MLSPIETAGHIHNSVALLRTAQPVIMCLKVHIVCMGNISKTDRKSRKAPWPGSRDTIISGMLSSLYRPTIFFMIGLLLLCSVVIVDIYLL